MNDIYFDNSATTKPHTQVIDEVTRCMSEYYANPSSAHRLGMEAEKKLKAARERVAALIGASPQEIIFTSGGSESNNMALLGMLSEGDHIITTKIEHPSILKLMKLLEEKGHEVTYLGVNSSGIIDLQELENAIKSNTKLVSIIYVNNEVGSIQPATDIVKIVRNKSKRARIHLDAVQAVGKLQIGAKALDVDMLSLSAHKIHGPKGVGALYLKKGLTLKPLILGGDQESGLRSGTENLPAISGFGIAAEIISTDIESKTRQVKAVKQHFIDRLIEIKDAKINSPMDDRHIDNILNISFSGVRGEVLLHGLEERNIYVSTGSACTAKKTTHKNHVLPAIGLKESDVEGAVRFSFSYINTISEVDYTVDVLKEVLQFLRRLKR